LSLIQAILDALKHAHILHSKKMEIAKNVMTLA